MMEVSKKMLGRRLKGCGLEIILLVKDFSPSFFEN